MYVVHEEFLPTTCSTAPQCSSREIIASLEAHRLQTVPLRKCRRLLPVPCLAPWRVHHKDDSPRRQPTKRPDRRPCGGTRRRSELFDTDLYWLIEGFSHRRVDGARVSMTFGYRPRPTRNLRHAMTRVPVLLRLPGGNACSRWIACPPVFGIKSDLRTLNFMAPGVRRKGLK